MLNRRNANELKQDEVSTLTDIPKKSQDDTRDAAIGAIILTLIVLGVLLGGLVLFSAFWTELKWFEQLSAVRVFWTQYGAWLIFSAIGAAIAAIVVMVSLRIALGADAKRNNKGKGGKEPSQPTIKLDRNGNPVGVSGDAVVNTLRKQRWLTLWVLPIVVGVLFGGQLGNSWQTFLLWLNSTPFKQTDPEFGHDVSFYIFTLPAIHELMSYLMMLVFLAVAATAVGYWINGKLEFKKGTGFSLKSRLHMGILAAIFALLVAVNFWLARYDLLLNNGTGSTSRFSGASFTDINASLPGMTILAISVAVIAVLILVSAIRNAYKPALVGIAATLVAGIVLTSVYPVLVQNFKVNPNAAELESEYIQRNINATRVAYGIDDVETQQYAARTDAAKGQLRQDSETAAQIRLLDPNIVSPSFNQLQQNRQYYQFTDNLTVDRYEIDGKMRDTVIAVRELNLEGLDDSRRSWVNDHTVFTHGFGIAAAYGNTATAKGDPAFWEAGIPSEGEIGEYESRIYFGQFTPSYSIVGAPEGTEPWELDYPDDKAPNGQVNTTYKGNGGPAISNVFEKLMYAIKFRSTELFFSDRVTSESQILFDRDPHERIAKIAPYLTLDSKALPAVVDMDGNPDTPKELVWIVDGFTTSNYYPYSARETLESAVRDTNTTGVAVNGANEINYIRNSVKAVVNAYDGEVTLFQWDQEDPIINAWKKVYPGQLTELKDMPGDLIAHVRYPEDLFKVQRSLLARYHVTDAKSFYSGGDFWQIPGEPTMQDAESTPPQPPYYMTLQMPGQDSASFSLTTSYIPGGNTKRNVMTGFLAADSNAGNEKGKIAPSYGKLRLLEAPRDLTVPGPGQAENTMLANPDVSTALNLLRQGGTTVREGNLLSLPIGGGLLYVQPLYVQASSGTQYPTLQYVLALFGDQVGFAPTLDEALDEVFGGDSGVSAGDAAIAGDKDEAVPSTTDTTSTTSTSGTDTSSTAVAPTTTDTSLTGLDKALNDAKNAIAESEAARREGDWAAYGVAQEKLAKAIEEAMAAQQAAGN